MRRQYKIRLHPEIHAAFKLLCDQAGYKRLNEAVEWIMLKCIELRELKLKKDIFGVDLSLRSRRS